MNNGWIKLHRQVLDWRWYTDPNTIRLFLHLLLKATSKPFMLGEIELLPGQLITGRKALSEELKLSEQEIRTAIQKLKNGKNVTIKTTNKFSIVTICNWEEYQIINTSNQPTEQPTEQPAINQPSTSHQPHTRIKELKELKEYKKKDDFVAQIIRAFQKSYFEFFSQEYALLNMGKERAAAGKILALYKQKFPDHSSTESLSGLSIFFTKCCKVPDPWLQKNMSLSMIVSKFNEIQNHINNGKSGKNGSVASKSPGIDAIVDSLYKA